MLVIYVEKDFMVVISGGFVMVVVIFRVCLVLLLGMGYDFFVCLIGMLFFLFVG